VEFAMLSSAKITERYLLKKGKPGIFLAFTGDVLRCFYLVNHKGLFSIMNYELKNSFS
jgi:hypothetical protein